MGHINKPTENSEGSMKKGATFASSPENGHDDLGCGSDEEPPKFGYEYRGKPKLPGAGTDVRTNTNIIRPAKQGSTKTKEQEEEDELELRAKAKAGKKTKQ